MFTFPKINGLMYTEFPIPGFTQPLSSVNNSFKADKKMFSPSSGIANLSDEIVILL